jgi:hypothetical protein
MTMAKQTVRQTGKTQRRRRALRKWFDGKFIGDNDGATSNGSYDPGFMSAGDSIPMYMEGAFAGGRWV